MRNMTAGLLVVPLLLTVFASADALAAPPPAPQESRLASGARLLVLPRAGAETVLFAVAVDAGSWDEPAGRTGMSHFLEHLLFDGVPGLDERGITEAFERHGAYANAFTREQTTVFFVLAPVASAPDASRLLVRMLTEPTIPGGAFEKAKKVILEELARDAARPDGVRDMRLRRALFAGTPAARPVGGVPDDVRAATREEVVAYHRTHYVGSRMRVLVAGSGSLESLRALAGPLAGIAPGTGPAQRPDPRRFPGWGRVKTVSAPEGARPRLALVVAPPEGTPPSPAATAMLARWLEAPDGPLAALREREDVIEIGVGPLALRPVPLLEISIVTSDDADRDALLRVLLATLEAAARSGPSRAAIARLDRAARAARERTLQRLHYAAIFFGEDFAAAPGRLVDALVVPPIEAPEVAEAARAWLAGLRPRARAAIALPGAAESEAALPGEAPSGAAVEIAAPTPFAAGPARSRVAVLANGLTLGVLEEPGGTVFGLHLLVADRALREKGPAGTAELLHRLLSAGTALSDREGLAARFEQLGVELKTADNPHIPFDDRYDTPMWSYVRMEGPAESLPGALDLLAEMIRLPEWDDAGWRRATSTLEAARRAAASGRAGTRVLMTRLFGEAHPLARPVPGLPGDPAPTAEDVRALLGSWPDGWFAPPRLILTVASPRTGEEVLDLVRPLFGSGPERAPARGPWPKASPATTSAEPPPAADGEKPERVIIAWGRIADVPPADRKALELALDAVSDRMTARIREAEGLAYRLGAGAGVLPDGRWLIRAVVTTRAGNRERVEELLAEILAGVATDPPDASTLARLAGRERRSTMLHGLAAVSRAEQLGRALYEGESAGKPAAALPTSAEVAAAARRWLSPDAMTRVVGR